MAAISMQAVALAAAVRGVVAVWHRHGPVLRAIAEAALGDDRVNELWRMQLMERFIEAVTVGIERPVNTPARSLAPGTLAGRAPTTS